MSMSLGMLREMSVAGSWPVHADEWTEMGKRSSVFSNCFLCLQGRLLNSDLYLGTDPELCNEIC